MEELIRIEYTVLHYINLSPSFCKCIIHNKLTLNLVEFEKIGKEIIWRRCEVVIAVNILSKQLVTNESESFITDLSCERRNSYNLAIVFVPLSLILLFFRIGAFPAAFN
jgi:hypothetical protein